MNQTSQYMKLLHTNAAPQDEQGVKLYVDNLLEGLAVDIEGRMRGSSKDRELSSMVKKEIMSRIKKLRF